MCRECGYRVWERESSGVCVAGNHRRLGHKVVEV